MNCEPGDDVRGTSGSGAGEVGTCALESPQPSPRPAHLPTADQARFRAIVDDHLDFTWRCLQRLGLPADVAEDATQRIFLIVSSKLDSIQPGSERAFLFNTAVRVASSEKRTFGRRREVPAGEETDEIRDPAPGVDELIDEHRARGVLDQVLQELEMSLRTVFVLFELEGMNTTEIGLMLGIPRGTAASRLRRAREAFRVALRRHQARAAQGTRRT